MNYYAHTAEGPDGRPERDQARWQLLSTHLRQVADLAKRFATPLDLACFTRPEMKVERVSYPVITPSAALLGVRVR